MLKQHEPQLVRYVAGDEDKEADDTALNYVEWRLIMTPHDETTSQANDSHDKGWVVTMSFHCGRKGKVMASTKVVPSAELLDILTRAGKHWNMAKIMMVTGQGNCL